MDNGSITAELIRLAPQAAIAFAGHLNTVIVLAKHVGTLFEHLLGRRKDVEAICRREIENVSNIVEPVAKGSACQLNVSTIVNGTLVLDFGLKSTEVDRLQNAANRKIVALREPVGGIHEQVLLYQAPNDGGSGVGDRGIIESIRAAPVRLVFRDDAVKTELLRSTENLLSHVFVVDVAVETVGGEPALYRVLTIRESFAKPDA